MWIRLLDRMLGDLIRIGRLEVITADGTRLGHGGTEGPQVTVRLNDPDLPRRLVTAPELALGEGYMDGRLTVDGDDLHGLMELLLRNRSAGASALPLRLNLFLRRALRGLRQSNPLQRARQNVAHHYDLSGQLYDLFLDTDKQYSCGYFRHPDDTLDQAQANKKHHIAGKLLHIGCGWGGMALTLARDYGARVVGVTLSKEQHAVATARAEAEGLDRLVEFRLQDYRTVEETFERIVSVGMFEHVGVPHYREYFSNVRDRLAPDGVALVHTIGRTMPPGSTSGWIDKYIFPGGYCPAMSETMQAVEKEQLYPQDVEVWRMHYAYTLRHWFDRFTANEERARALYDDRFCRMWRYYLVACEQTFRYFAQCVFQFQLGHHPQAAPITRDYLYPATEARAQHAAE